jgi:hypothetical protein
MSARRRRVSFIVNDKKQPAGTIFKNSLKEWRLRSQVRLGGQNAGPDKGYTQAPPA